MPARRFPRWVLYFAALVVLGAAAVTIPLVYNLSQQLDPDQVRAARQRWRGQGVRDYDLACLARVDQNPLPHQYEVAVRGERVVWVKLDGEVYLPREQQGPVGMAVGVTLRCVSTKTPTAAALAPLTVEGMFARMEEDLRDNALAGGKNYAAASFDSATGAPMRYVYRVRGSTKRVEWNVRLQPAP
jgi:hypothetical protein